MSSSNLLFQEKKPEAIIVDKIVANKYKQMKIEFSILLLLILL